MSEIDELIVLRCSDREAAERELVRIVLSAPAEGVTTCNELGITTQSFIVRQDMRLMFAVCELYGERGQLGVCKLIRGLLRINGFWSEIPPDQENELVWHNDKLADFAESFDTTWRPFSRLYIQHKAGRRLIALHSCLRDAGEHHRRAIDILENGAAA